MPDTGGDLNLLNGKKGISAPHKSVPVMKLITEHNPKSHQELVSLIEKHVGGADCCSVVSQGTVEDFGKNLYDAQQDFWGEEKYTLEECIEWEYDLFISQSLKGDTMETMAINKLKKRLSDIDSIKFEESNEIVDNEYRIDIEVKSGNTIISGIQVKPNSYSNMRSEVKFKNKSANRKYEGDVLYLFYDYDSEELDNLEMVEDELRDIVTEEDC
jgi:hypothetical protein